MVPSPQMLYLKESSTLLLWLLTAPFYFELSPYGFCRVPNVPISYEKGFQMSLWQYFCTKWDHCRNKLALPLKSPWGL